jgi:hypothetical protein
MDAHSNRARTAMLVVINSATFCYLVGVLIGCFQPWDFRLFTTVFSRHYQIRLVGWRGTAIVCSSLDDKTRWNYWQGAVRSGGVYLHSLEGKFELDTPVAVSVGIGSAYVGDPIAKSGVPGSSLYVNCQVGVIPNSCLLILLIWRLRALQRRRRQGRQGFELKQMPPEDAEHSQIQKSD